MSKGKRWSRDELIIAMNLYCKLPFGQLDHRTPIIIEVSQKLGRTPSSLAMKLCNLASLDPSLQARGIKGLVGSSKADREIFEEFLANWKELGIESEEKFQTLFEEEASTESLALIQYDEKRKTTPLKKLPTRHHSGVTETETTIRVRIGQSFFRQTILASYENHCCITGNPIPELLVASHILPWSSYEECRINPSNGLCLARTQDAAFDKGLITFDDNYCLILSTYLESFLPKETLEQNFAAYRGQPIRLPEKFQPNPEFLRIHREEIFLS
jgi:putative restriction endonuclease